MKKGAHYFLFFLILLLLPLVLAHEEATPTTSWPEPFLILNYALVLFAVLLAVALCKKKASHATKRFLFWSMVIIIGSATLYLATYTIIVNMTSETEGPVHWHADFEIWICGEKQTLPQSTGFENKIGTGSFHHHNDDRIHIEGVVAHLEDVTLSKFFETIGGSLTENSLGIPQEDRSIDYWQNEDRCPDGSKGTVSVFVQKGDSNDWLPVAEFPDYVISPESDVPPGDRLKIVFDSQKTLKEENFAKFSEEKS